MTFLRQSFVILLSIGLAMFIKSLFSSLIVSIVGILVILYMVFLNRKKIVNFNIFILTTLVLILISSTGEISSPLFFLLYFLSFGIAFVFDPKVVFVFTIGVILSLFPSTLKTDLTRNLILLFSLFLLSPLAFFLGVAYQKNQEAKRRIEDMKKKAQEIENDIEDVSYDSKQKLDAQAAEKLSEVLLETEEVEEVEEEARIVEKINKIKRNSFLLLVVCSLLFVAAPTAQAQTMSNQNYIIQTEELNTLSNTTDIQDNSSLKPTVQEPSPFVSKRTLPFSVSLSSDLVDFGTLSPTNPIIRTVELSVDSLSSLGYSIIVSEDHPLKSDKSSIPDATCDNGECNEENAGVWINTLTYGFGYRCDNITGFDCERSFHNSNFYKSFADSSNSNSPQSVMTGIGSKNKETRISYKVNIAGTQGQGIYNNIITYIAVPNF